MNENTDENSSQVTETAPGSGTIANVAPQATLQTKLTAAAVTLAGMEDLSATCASTVSEVLAAATPLTKNMLQAVLSYMRDTGANSNLSADAGARKQVTLYRELQNYINNAPVDFRKGFGTVLRIIADQKKDGVFSPRFIFRFAKDLKMSNNDRQGMESLFVALVSLSEPNGRAAALRQVDLARVGAQSLNAEGAQKLTSFFAT